MDVNKLTVNVNKTKYLVFSKTNINLNIMYKGIELECVEQFKYLGVILEKSLSWEVHLNKLTSALSSICGLFRKISDFIPINVRCSLFHSFFQSKILYGLIIWGTTYKTKMRKIQTIQNT